MRFKILTAIAIALLSCTYAGAQGVRRPAPHVPQQPRNNGVRPGRPTQDRGVIESRNRVHEQERAHFDGRHFDEGYRERYFGRAHYFSPNIEVVEGGGFRFFYGGFYFGFVEPIPFVTENFYIDLGPDGFYYVYAPMYPEWSMRVEVIL